MATQAFRPADPALSAAAASQAPYVSIDAVLPGDLESLLAAAIRVGMDADEVCSLREAIESDRGAGHASGGPELDKWLSGVKTCSAHGICGISSSVVTGVIEPMLRKFVSVER